MTTTEKVIIGGVLAFVGYFIYTKYQASPAATGAIEPVTTDTTGNPFGSITSGLSSIFSGAGTGSGGNVSSGVVNILSSGTISSDGGDVTASAGSFDDQSDTDASGD